MGHSINRLFVLFLTLFFFLFSLYGKGSEDRVEGEANTRIVKVLNAQGLLFNLDFTESECLFAKSENQICVMDMEADFNEEKAFKGFYGLEKLQGLKIRIMESGMDIVKGQITLTRLPERSRTLSYIIDLRSLPEWIQSKPDLITLMTALNPLLIEMVVTGLEAQSSDEAHTLDSTAYVFKPKIIPIPSISKENLNQIIQIDLGDHYTLLVRVDADKQPVKAYVGDRLDSMVRVTRDYFRWVLGVANFLELAHHMNELQYYGSSARNYFQNGLKESAENMLGLGVHSFEIYNHAQQFGDFTSVQDLLKDGDSLSEKLQEILMFVNSAREVGTGFMDSSVLRTQRVMRVAAATVSLINLLKDNIPSHWGENSSDELLRFFLQSEFKIELPYAKDEL